MFFRKTSTGGALLPCTKVDFDRIVDSEDVAWRINMRQGIENAIAEGLPLDSFIANGRFQSFCNKRNEEASFQKLSPEQKLLQWTNSLKMGLPCFIFAAKSFKGEQRKLEDIKLSPLFMFDADHLPCNPKEIYERTLVELRLGLDSVLFEHFIKYTNFFRLFTLPLNGNVETLLFLGKILVSDEDSARFLRYDVLMA